MTDWVGLAAHLGLVVGIFLAMFVLARHLGTDSTLHALPAWAEMLVAALAMSPYVAMVEGWLPGVVPHEEVFTFALMLFLWAVLPDVGYRLLDPEPKSGGVC